MMTLTHRTARRNTAQHRLARRVALVADDDLVRDLHPIAGLVLGFPAITPDARCGVGRAVCGGDAMTSDAAVKAVDRVRILRTSTLEQLVAVRKEIEGE